MKNIKKARRVLYEVMESGNIKEILEASQKLDKLIIRQMYQQQDGKKAVFI